MNHEYITELISKLEQTSITIREQNRKLKYDEGIQKLVDIFTKHKREQTNLFFIGNGGSSAIASHMTADFMKNGGMNDYMKVYAKAFSISPDYCFPNRLEAVLALRDAISVCPNDAKAPYYLGLLYHDKRQYDLSKELWIKSAHIDDSYPTVWRNLALIYMNKEKSRCKF